MTTWRGGAVRVRILSDRGGISTGALVQAGADALLVDCGDGIGRDLADLRLPVNALRAVVITHDHADHAAGLSGLLWWLRLAGRREPLPVLGPRRSPTLDGLIALHRGALSGRMRFAIRRRRLVDESFTEARPFAVRPFAVRHRRSASDPPGRLMEVHGITVLVRGRRIVFSADTGPCLRLTQAVAGADLAVIEANFANGLRSAPPDTHLTVGQARALGRTAKAYRLYHRS